MDAVVILWAVSKLWLLSEYELKMVSDEVVQLVDRCQSGQNYGVEYPVVTTNRYCTSRHPTTPKIHSPTFHTIYISIVHSIIHVILPFKFPCHPPLHPIIWPFTWSTQPSKWPFYPRALFHPLLSPSSSSAKITDSFFLLISPFNLSICPLGLLSVHPFVRPSNHQSLPPSFHLAIHLSVVSYLPIYLPIRPSDCLSFHPSNLPSIVRPFIHSMQPSIISSERTCICSS